MRCLDLGAAATDPAVAPGAAAPRPGRLRPWRLRWWTVRHRLASPLDHASARAEHLESLVLVVDFAEGVPGRAEVRTNGTYATGEDTGTVLSALTGTACTGRQVDEVLADLLPASRLAAMALDVAAHDAAGRLTGQPLHRLLGGSGPVRWPTHAQIPFGTVAAAGERASRAVAAGFGRVKIRVGGDVDHDLTRVSAVRRAVGSEVELLTDANAAWDVRGAVRAAEGLARLDVAWLEQPVASMTDLARVGAASPVPVRADESARDADSVRALAGTVAGVHLKLEKAGTVARLREAVTAAREVGLAVALGQMDQGRLGCAATTALAVGLDVAEAELWGCADIRPADDVATGLPLVDGSVLVPTGPGLGVDLHLDTTPTGELP
ncbi:chloromuconate cycloisomerase [Desertihabitans brevis]|uniref:Chloromuconate cycloisomerase n=1 Tax=Desertihabitans brevis TaxID=2268447 RepID=A0A367YTJ3_9ACTN|nr:enolase C-terminal domain-like protein [Desertihabitans brevis]RCK69077.1 chloromuconate cycloisomerase [Desertihabitans brevis]